MRCKTVCCAVNASSGGYHTKSVASTSKCDSGFNLENGVNGGFARGISRRAMRVSRCLCIKSVYVPFRSSALPRHGHPLLSIASFLSFVKVHFEMSLFIPKVQVRNKAVSSGMQSSPESLRGPGAAMLSVWRDERPVKMLNGTSSTLSGDPGVVIWSTLRVHGYERREEREGDWREGVAY